MFLLGLENVSKGTSEVSVLRLVNQQLAELFNLPSFTRMTKGSNGKSINISDRRMRQIAVVHLWRQEKCNLGIVDNVLRRVVQDVKCRDTGFIQVVRGASMKDLDFQALLISDDLSPMQRLVCELMHQRGNTLSAHHFDPVDVLHHETVAVDCAKTPHSSSSVSTSRRPPPKTPASASIVVSRPL